MYADEQGDGAKLGTVLVLEDEALVSAVIEDCLLELGAAQVVVCSSLDEAHRVAAETAVHCGILDVLIGAADSYGLADMLAARNVPFMFASALGAEEIVERHRHRPLLTKPFSDRRLADAIRAVVLGVREDA